MVSLLGMTLCLSSCDSKTKLERKLKDEGVALLQNKDYNLAIKKLDDALKIKDLNKLGALEIDILRYRAEAEYLVGDYIAAEHTYHILMDADENMAIYKNMRVICMAKSYTDLELAIALYEEVDKANISSDMHDEALQELATALVKKGREIQDNSYIEKAKALYERINTDSRVNDPIMCNQIGKFYMNLQEYEKAKEWFEKGIARDGNHPDILYNQACCYEYLGEYKIALELFEKYIEKFGEDESALHEILFLKSRLVE